MKNILLFALFLFSEITFGQESYVAQEISHKNIDADVYIGEDGFGFVYFIKNNVLIKTNEKENYQYKNLSLGKITRIDLQNPLRIILFYENFNTLIALDNQLNEIQKVNFTKTLLNPMVTATGIASLNNYWIFDSNHLQLGFYNYINNEYTSIGVPFDKNIKKYHTNYNYFYWIDDENNYYHCTIFGKKSFLAKLPIYEQICIIDEHHLVYLKDENLYLFDLKTVKSTRIENIQKSFKSFEYKNQNLIIFTNEGIINYKIKLP